MAQNPKGGEQAPAVPQRPATASPAKPVVDVTAERNRRFGPKLQVLRPSR